MEKLKLDSRDDIALLVNSFYEKVKTDDLLGDIFNNAENFSWDTHIPVMINFWETMLLGTASYKGNTMRKHLELNKRTPLTPVLFERWKELFYSTLETLFEGPAVEAARKKVEAVSGLMQYKINQSALKGFIQ